MATLASRPAEASASRIRRGVPPLRAGQGRSFLWRRLHSLSGIFPVGAFLVEHFISNLEVVRGAAAYNHQVEFLTGLPFVLGMEIVFIYIPILYHALYGFYVWYRGEANVGDYSFVGNWVYTAQRWTGGIAFFYIVYHTLTMRFTGVHLMTEPAQAFAKVHQAFQSAPVVAFYAIGVIAASWHFGAGLWLFLVKWGIVTGEQSRRRFAWLCGAVAALFIVAGLASLAGFFGPVPAATGMLH